MSFPGAESVSIFLLANAVKSAVLLCGAWAITAALRKRSAALRHRVWLTAIFSALILPVLSPVLPAWHSNALGFALAHLGANVSSATQQSVRPAVVVDAIMSRRASATWPTIVLAIWAAGCGLLLVRLAAGFAHLAAVESRSAALLDRDWIFEAARISNGLGILRPVRLFQSADPQAMPLAWGLFQHKILVPSSAAEWNADRRRIVLLHELTHIARQDCAVQIVCECVRAIYWLNPLAWLAASRVRRESEFACDDSVLQAGIPAIGYADHLLALARSLDHRITGWLPALAVARSTHLERRFTAMLNSTTDRTVCTRKFKLSSAFVALCCLILLAAVRLPGQSESGKFSGTIYDPSGAAVPNATIIMIDQAADTRDMTTSDAVGNFQFAKLPAGQYEMQVMKPGFKTNTVPGISLQANNELSQNATLVLGSVEESVQVTGQRPGGAGAAPTTTETEKAKRIRIGGNVQAAKIFAMTTPVYPDDAKAAGVEGIVVLHAVISKNGTPMSLRVMNGEVDPRLARAAVEAVSHWRYRPTLLNGEPVEVDTTIQVNYTLKN